MKKNLTILSAIIGGLSILAAKADPIKIAGYPLYSIQNQKIIAKIFGTAISYQWVDGMTWPDVLQAISAGNGSVDCAMDVGYTAERGNELQYVPTSYAREVDAIVFHSSISGLPHTFEDMESVDAFFRTGNGKGLSLGGVIKTKTGNPDFDNYMITKKLFNSNQEKYDAFNNHEVDAIVIYGNEAVSGDVKKVPLDFIEDSLYIACSKSVNSGTIKQMDDAVKVFLKDPSYKETLGDAVGPVS